MNEYVVASFTHGQFTAWAEALRRLDQMRPPARDLVGAVVETIG